MMAALPPADRARLAKVLGMLGSDAAGERAAAGLQADRIIRAAGLTWPEVLGQPETATTPHAHQPAYRPPARMDRREAEAWCRRHGSQLNAWELSFLAGITRRASLTAKQLGTLLRIAGDLPRGAK